MSTPKPSTIAAIDIGTATIKVVIARVEDGRLIPGIADLAADVFGLPARVGTPAHSDAPGLSDPSYSTVLGLLRYCTAIR